MSGLYALIATLTILVAVGKEGFITSLPADIVLGWGFVVLLGVVASLFFLTKSDETEERD